MSGSGKSSILFDTIATAAQRQLYENFSLFVRNFLPRYVQPAADAIVATLTERLQHVADIGLEYLSLNRQTDTLSGQAANRSASRWSRTSAAA